MLAMAIQLSTVFSNDFVTAVRNLCVGFNRSLSQERVRETMKKIMSEWAS